MKTQLTIGFGIAFASAIVMGLSPFPWFLFGLPMLIVGLTIVDSAVKRF